MNQAQEKKLPRKKIYENIHFVKMRFASIISEPIHHLSLVGGMTNDNFKVTTLTNTYFVRIPGSGTSTIINRQNELYNIKEIQRLGIDAPIIYCDSLNGFKITEYIPNSEVLSKHRARLPNNLEKSANLLRRLHQSNVKFINKFDFKEILIQYTKSLKNPVSYENYQRTYDNIQYIHKWLLSDFEYCEAPCHNDLVPENLLLNEKNKLFLIDWEYSGFNDYYWDLASYLLECEANKKEGMIFLSAYLNRVPNEKDWVKIKIFQAFQDILWSIWALVKEEAGSGEFINYGNKRYKRGVGTLEELIEYV